MINNIDKYAKDALKEAQFRKQKQNLRQLEEKLSLVNKKISEISNQDNLNIDTLNSLTQEKQYLLNEVAKNLDQPKEIGGPEGPEPTRYGDWEKKGIVSDF